MDSLPAKPQGKPKNARVGKNPPAKAPEVRNMGLIPGLIRFSGGGHGNLLQHSCLENIKDRKAWRATVYRVAKSQIRLKQLNMCA